MIRWLKEDEKNIALKEMLYDLKWGWDSDQAKIYCRGNGERTCWALQLGEHKQR